uniref:FOSW, CJUN PROTEIN, COILED COIL DOMAIN n=1 Tax=Siphoviridae sp. ctBCr48 TaxID=2827802 RepID=A0A8S5SHF9_9CAUD|nr:MAG TPA: FOSW, CJUN PROTEIN, COILED COIL DOMAIN [Siphoviridae sp. ctBCr48]
MMKRIARLNDYRKLKNKNGDIPFEASRVRGSANHGSALHLLR